MKSNSNPMLARKLLIPLLLAAISLFSNCPTEPVVTPPDATAPTPGAAVSFSAIQPTSVTINWGAGVDDVTPAVDLQYKLVTASAAAAIDTVAEADAVSGGDLLLDWTDNVVNEPVTGLAEQTTYFFAVLVRDQAVNRALYSPASVTTPASAAPVPGAAISFTDVLDDSVTVNWGAANDDNTAAADLQYKLVWSSSAADIDTVAEANAVTGTSLALDWTDNVLSENVSGLTADTLYYFAVLVRDAAGNMALYAPQSVTTAL